MDKYEGRGFWCAAAFFAVWVIGCLVLMSCLGGCSRAEPPTNTRHITLPDGRKIEVPANAKVRVRYVKKDTTKMRGAGGTFDSFRETGGEFQPGGVESFDLSKGTWKQHAAQFSLEVGKTGFSQVFLLGAAAVIGGAVAFAFTKQKKYLWVSAAGVALIVLGYFLQEYGGWVFILAIVAGLIAFLFCTRAGANLRGRLLRYVRAMGKAISDAPNAVELARATDRNSGDGLRPVLEKQGVKVVDIHRTEPYTPLSGREPLPSER